MRWLLLLYPADWRRRYGAEMELFLGYSRPHRPGDALDLLRGALDAHLHPQWGRRRRPGLIGLALVVLAAALVGRWVAVAGSRRAPAGSQAFHHPVDRLL